MDQPANLSVKNIFLNQPVVLGEAKKSQLGLVRLLSTINAINNLTINTGFYPKYQNSI
jgi:hypothetical protein